MRFAIRKLCVSPSDGCMAQWQYSRSVRLNQINSSPGREVSLQLDAEPGKRSLVLGVNGFGNLAGVIGAQLYRPKYRPHYLPPFYGTLGFVAAALAGYTAYRFTLMKVNRRKLRIMGEKTTHEVEQERTDMTRYADKKWTFIYGL